MLVAGRLRGDAVCIELGEREADTAETEPENEMRRSRSVAWSTVGKSENRVASLRSVDCSSSSVSIYWD